MYTMKHLLGNKNRKQTNYNIIQEHSVKHILSLSSAHLSHC